LEILEKDLEPYLSGDKFSNGLVVGLPRKHVSINGRITTLRNLSRDKNIIHFGYCDHPPLIPQKIKDGKWLHGLLTEETKSCIGLDINDEAVRILASDFGVTNGYKFDLLADQTPDIVKSTKWDCLVMGEILEHVDNPVLFLNHMREKFEGYVSHLIITVPNAFDLTNMTFLRRNTEVINTDHRYWFTPFTLAKVAYRANLSLESIHMCDDAITKSKWRKFRINRRPILAETIIGVFRFNN
jgi:hypothetical protein